MTPEEETPERTEGSRSNDGCGWMILILVVLVGVLLWTPFANFLSYSRAKSSMKQSYQIGLCLQRYAYDHDGEFPTSVATSNDAFRDLFRVGIVEDERLFYLGSCAWHAGKKPDGNIGSAENGFAEALSKNENHWAYTSGLNQKTSPEKTPIVMSGFTETPGIWCGDTNKKGGVWAGKYAIILDVSGRARVVDLDKEYCATESVNREWRNVLDRVKLVPGAKLLNPDG